MSDKLDQHSVIALLKEMTIELGSVPNGYEFCKRSGVTNYRVRVLFGNYSNFCQAAGFAEYSERRKVTNAIFERPLASHLASRTPEPAPIAQSSSIPTIAAISDIHWPFSSERVVSRFLEYVADVRPEVVLINGDAWDMYSHTRFPRSHNVFTPREEQASARASNEEFWLAVRRAHPEARCFQLLGNHDVRPMKRILEAYPEAEDWIEQKLRELFSFSGVETLFDPRQELIFGNVCIHHGYRSKLGDHRDYTHMNSIAGHTHAGGVVFRRIRGETLWELNCGYAGNPESKGLTYTPQKITHWTPGFGVLGKYGPQFVSVSS